MIGEGKPIILVGNKLDII